MSNLWTATFKWTDGRSDTREYNSRKDRDRDVLITLKENPEDVVSFRQTDPKG